MGELKVVSEMTPRGDQPQAIERLAEGEKAVRILGRRKGVRDGKGSGSMP